MDDSSRSRSRSRRAATSRVDRLWEYGVIPYEIDSNFSGKDVTSRRVASLDADPGFEKEGAELANLGGFIAPDMV